MSQYDVVRIIRALGGEARPRDVHEEARRLGIYSGAGGSAASAHIARAVRKGWLVRREVGGEVRYAVTPEAP
jgi:hypothetical protein